MQNELCKGFVHEIIKAVVFITFYGAKIDEIHLPFCGGKPCTIENQESKKVKYWEKLPEILPKYVHIKLQIWFPKSN